MSSISTELILLPPEEVGKLTVPSPHHYVHAATSANTRKAYQADIRHFLQSLRVLPATAESILDYLHDYATTLNPRTLTRRLTALKQWHILQGHSDPTSHPLVHKTLSGIRNVHGKPKDKAPAITLESLTQMITHLKKSTRLIDCRNNALLQLGFFGAFRRSEVVTLIWDNIHFVPEGIEILLPRSKTDQAGEGQTCAIPYGDNTLCPVTALLSWQERSQCSTGSIFRQMTRGETIKHAALKPQHLNTIIKNIARESQLSNADDYSSHSLRRGFATEASKNGAPFGSIMRQGRWRHEGTVLGYIDEGKRFDQNAAGLLLQLKR
jgi:site-specific recombinase XerD